MTIFVDFPFQNALRGAFACRESEKKFNLFHSLIEYSLEMCPQIIKLLFGSPFPFKYFRNHFSLKINSVNFIST